VQSYRTAKPHGPGECPQCAPSGHGHHLCQNDGCDETATAQTSRHATDTEYAAMPESLRPIDGTATQAVFGCDDCTEDGQFNPFCTHTLEPVPCPKCQAAGDAPCIKKNGAPRETEHRARADAQPQPEPCRHVHRADCPVFTGCQCTADDPIPARPARIVASVQAVDISGLTVPVSIAQAALERAGQSWGRVVRAWSMLTQNGQPAVSAEIQQYDTGGNLLHDVHGHPVTETVTVPVPIGAGPKTLLSHGPKALG